LGRVVRRRRPSRWLSRLRHLAHLAQFGPLPHIQGLAGGFLLLQLLLLVTLEVLRREGSEAKKAEQVVEQTETEKKQ
jgi:hypothetical protein